MLETVRINKELLAEDDTWELGGPMYMFKRKTIYQDGKSFYQIHIVSYFDKELMNYNFKPIFIFQTEVD